MCIEPRHLQPRLGCHIRAASASVHRGRGLCRAERHLGIGGGAELEYGGEEQ